MGLLSNVELNNTTYGIRSTAIPYGEVDSTSTSTAYTATIPEIKELSNGICMFLKNGVVTSAANFTININNLGAKPSYNNMATGYEGTAPTRDTTIFNVNYTMFFVYSEDIVDGGAWICYRGYDANTNTIGYQLRTNSTIMVTSDASRYYKIYFTSADGTKWVPAAANTSSSATTAKTVNQRPINPFGRIVYMSASTNFAAGANLTATAIWDQYNVTLGYSFNRTGAALTLTTKTPVYIKCAPQSDGSAIIDADNPYVQDLPSTADGKIYIFLGIATSATQVEIVINHPIYYYKDGAIRLWTNAADSGVTSITAGTGLSGGTITSTGTIALADTYGDTKNPYGTKNANTVLAGPSSGSAAAPSFRALVDADIPKTNSYSATGTTAITGTGVAAALETLDSSVTASSGQAISAITITDGKISSSSKINVGDANQNAFSNVKIGSATIAADTTTDTLEMAAEPPIVLTSDTTNDKVTVSLADAYGDIKNPYGVKPLNTVLTSNTSVTNTYSDYIFANNATSGNYTVASNVSLSAGSYMFSALVTTGTGGTRNARVWVNYDGNEYDGNTLGATSSGRINATSSCAFNLTATTSVTLGLYAASTLGFESSPITFSQIKLIKGLPAFKELTIDDIPSIVNATNGGLTVGSSNGNITIGHSNVLSSGQAQSGVYPITYDKNGHITSVGSAISYVQSIVRDLEAPVYDVTTTSGSSPLLYDEAFSFGILNTSGTYSIIAATKPRVSDLFSFIASKSDTDVQGVGAVQVYAYNSTLDTNILSEIAYINSVSRTLTDAETYTFNIILKAISGVFSGVLHEYTVNLTAQLAGQDFTVNSITKQDVTMNSTSVSYANGILTIATS